jgi:hypothetical protein
MEPTGLRIRRPYLLITLIVATITAVNLVCAGAAMALPPAPPMVLELLAELILAVLAIALLTRLTDGAPSRHRPGDRHDQPGGHPSLR